MGRSSNFKHSLTYEQTTSLEAKERGKVLQRCLSGGKR